MRIYDVDRPEQYKRFSGSLVSGPYSTIFVIDTLEDASVVGVHFKPGGAFPFLGLPAGELRDTHVDLETLWGMAAVELRERLCSATTSVRRFHLLEKALLAHLFRPLRHHDAVSNALHAFAHTDATSVREVTKSIGLSHRRFVDVFNIEVGMTPKLFQRVQRFHRALALVRQTAMPHWAQLALNAGYFDQSHLIRDFLSFSGVSPADYLLQQNCLRQRNVNLKRNHVPLAA